MITFFFRFQVRLEGWEELRNSANGECLTPLGVMLAENSIPNLGELSQIWIVITLFRLA